MVGLEEDFSKSFTGYNERRFLKQILLGQGLSVLLCGTGVTSQYLAKEFAVETPMFQSFLNYLLLCLVYTGILAFRQGEENLMQILKTKWWKYLLLGLIDVEANYMIVKAYQYTTLTSVQLLDCFTIPVVMFLSWFILHSRYKVLHFVAISICLMGVGVMVGADILAEREQGSVKNILLGDLLVLGGAILYGCSNVCEEYVVKNLSRVEFLGMIGLFGTFISSIQLGIVEHNTIAAINWNWEIVLLFIAFAACMFALYNLMPIVVKFTNATSINLATLTADLYSLLIGVFLFNYEFSGLYFLAFVAIIFGFILYSSVPLPTAENQDPVQTVSSQLDVTAQATEVSAQEPTVIQHEDL
ncbi:solute carrier family 35 member F2 [Callorhinchus milii]|uniref:solute carrier family 35 member F2 n=1 Tax=Callorhinchus milii TaxID=7868 RepID=UPI001C3FAF4B|nr:solute carrier family 35 member F2 [Callorhinchus milii]